MKIIETLTLVVSLWASSSLPLFSGGVSWGSSIFGDTFLDSDGQPLDSSWTFYLGYFGNSFSPTEQNRSQWAANWMTLDITDYDPAMSSFESIWANDGISEGNRGYIWALNRNNLDNEWILMTGDSWFFPLNSPIDPDVNWFTTDVTTLVAGSQQGGTNFTTEKTIGNPPLLDGSDWLDLNFEQAELNDSQVGGWNADPDQDGFSNLEEFAFGGDPKTSDSVCIEPVMAGDSFQFRCPKLRQVAVSYLGEVSFDLVTWNTGPAFVVLEQDEHISLLFRDLTANSQSRRFARVAVQLIDSP